MSADTWEQPPTKAELTRQIAQATGEEQRGFQQELMRMTIQEIYNQEGNEQ